MRRWLLPLALFGVALAAAGLAGAQPPSGVTRPGAGTGKSLVDEGGQLYAANCASCHGIGGVGIAKPRAGIGGKGQGPRLIGVGAQAVDFYLRTGYMPLSRPDEQPYRSRPKFSDHEIKAITAYVTSLGAGPPIPRPNPDAGSVPEGKQLFTEHCAGCHQEVAEGGYVTNARVPPLEQATPTQVAEAVRIGPYYMPKFSRRDISDAQLNSIVAYVQTVREPDDRGGWGIGHIGPVPEGLVAWFIAGAAMVALCVVIGKRVSE